MKLTKLSVALLTTAVLTGCANSATPETTTAETTTVAETTLAETTTAVATTESETKVGADTDERFKDLVLNEYDGLEVTAVMLQRNAIIPGLSIPITVSIKNTGDKTLTYVQGSGSFETPEALVIDSTDLQVVLPKDHLGIMTMDFRTEILEPGAEITFVTYLKAIEPNEEFDNYTADLYMKENTYIADLDWEELQAEYPDLVAAKAGTYKGTASFIYAIQDDENSSPFTESTGYAESQFTISVTE